MRVLLPPAEWLSGPVLLTGAACGVAAALQLGTVIQTSVGARHPPASVLFAGGSHG
jgi:hypothetical protein